MLVRCYDILIDSIEDGQNTLKEFGQDVRLHIHDRNFTDAVERAEYIGDMMDKISEYTGKDVYSFSYETVG
jgi:hypothetical protein